MKTIKITTKDDEITIKNVEYYDIAKKFLTIKAEGSMYNIAIKTILEYSVTDNG